MKICAYVNDRYAKQSYKRECFDTRRFVGLRVIIDCLERAGYAVDYAGSCSVHEYDVVLVSVTADCDWWEFIRERLTWRRGDYKIVVGGAGVLHVSPFMPFIYAAIFGRGEDIIVPLVDGVASGERYECESVAYSDTFSEDDIYRVAQARCPYPHELSVNGRPYVERTIGCNHSCLFCGYTWQRRFDSPYEVYKMDDPFGGIADKERALLDMMGAPGGIDFAHLRTTAIDGFSERLRYGVGKRISRETLLEFVGRMLRYEGKPHQLKLYNILGYPTETEDDWEELLDVMREADDDAPARERQWSIVLHCTPFRAMPATPMACAPMSKRNYRGAVGRTLGAGLRGNLIYQGRSLWAVESMGTDSLSAVMLSAIAHRGSRDDAEGVARLCRSRKFWQASAATRELTLSRYFDMDGLFSAFTPETLPSRYLRTFRPVERAWGKTPLEVAYHADT